jgi:hypothetical protein
MIRRLLLISTTALLALSSCASQPPAATTTQEGGSSTLTATATNVGPSRQFHRSQRIRIYLPPGTILPIVPSQPEPASENKP